MPNLLDEAPHQPPSRSKRFIWDILTFPAITVLDRLLHVSMLWLFTFRFTSDLQFGMDGDLSPAGSGSEEPPPSVPGVDATGGYLQNPPHTHSKIIGIIIPGEKDYSNLALGPFCCSCSPLSKALVVPFSTSSVRAAMMSAWRAMAWALSTASAPREVIIWVPLIRARPCSGDTRLEVHM